MKSYLSKGTSLSYIDFTVNSMKIVMHWNWLIVPHVKSSCTDIQLETVYDSLCFLFISLSIHLQHVRVPGELTVPNNARRIIMDVCVKENVTALQTSIVIMSEDACVIIPVSIVQRKVRSTTSHLHRETKIFS